MKKGIIRAVKVLSDYADKNHTGAVTFYFNDGGIRDIHETRTVQSPAWSAFAEKPTGKSEQ